jgi:hypothetical protein
MNSFGPFQVLKGQKLQPQLHFAFLRMIAEPESSQIMIMKQTIPHAMLSSPPDVSLLLLWRVYSFTCCRYFDICNGLECDNPPLSSVLIVVRLFGH